MSIQPRPSALSVRSAGRCVRAGDRSDLALRDLRWLTWVPIALLGSLVLASVLATASVRQLALPMAVAGALVGIPHGAIDHLIPLWLSNSAGPRPTTASSPSTRRSLVVIALGYAGVALLALSLLLVATVPTLLVFLLVSVAHFGWGEVVTGAQRAGRPIPRVAHEWLVAVAYGVVVVGSVIWMRPEQTGSLISKLSPWLADAALRSRTTGLVLIALVVAAAVVVLLRRERYLETAELALLGVAFSVAPPLAVFGLYFGGWHALRHTGRLMDLARDRGPRLRTPNDWRAAGGALTRAAWLPSLMAFAAVAALWLLRDRGTLIAEVGVLVALTFPHVLVVAELDSRQEVDGVDDHTTVGVRHDR